MGARPGHTGSLAGILSAAQNLSILEPRNGLELFPAKPSRNNLAQNSSPLLIAYLKCTQVRHRAKGLFTYLHLSHISRYIIVTRMMLKLKQVDRQVGRQVPINVTRFDEFLPLWKNVKSFGKILKVNLSKTLYYWANFQCCKWPNIGHIIQLSGQTCTNSRNDGILQTVIQLNR